MAALMRILKRTDSTAAVAETIAHPNFWMYQ